MSKATDKFEIDCTEYLKKQFGSDSLTFERVGGNDSSQPDILVKKDNRIIGSIEVKMDCAQCSQFVLFADHENRKFIYSDRNKPNKPSKESQAIMDLMTNDFDNHKNPSPKELGFGEDIYCARIIDYYKNYKKSQFFMTKRKAKKGAVSSYIIFPTDQLRYYFETTACYRYKNSGSHNPSFEEIESSRIIVKDAENLDVSAVRHTDKDDKKDYYTDLEIKNGNKALYKIETPFRLQLKKLLSFWYRLTILGDTKNPNVIFTIKVKNDQRAEDLEKFKSFIGK